MKKIILHILLFAGLFGMLTTSCSQEADDLMQISDDSKAQVVFTIAFDNSPANSRGSWDPNDTNNGTNMGTWDEDIIDPDMFYVQIEISNGSKPEIYDVENLEYERITTNEYRFTGDVNVKYTPTDFKIMVYANINPTEKGDFDVTFKRNVKYIPMFGVQTPNLLLAPGYRTVLPEPIYLLRAMAKVEVEFITPGYDLVNLTLKKYNTDGYCLPNNYKDISNTTDLCYPDDIDGNSDTPSCLRVKANDPNVTLAPLSFTIKDNHLVYYLPEVQNSTSGNGDLTMTLTITDNENNTFTLNGAAPVLYFKDYRTNIPFDVVRNHWYKYTISIYNKAEFNVSYEAEDWVDIEPGTLNFGDENGATIDSQQ